jgi:hypothetical protein
VCSFKVRKTKGHGLRKKATHLFMQVQLRLRNGFRGFPFADHPVASEKWPVTFASRALVVAVFFARHFYFKDQ